MSCLAPQDASPGLRALIRIHPLFRVIHFIREFARLSPLYLPDSPLPSSTKTFLPLPLPLPLPLESSPRDHDPSRQPRCHNIRILDVPRMRILRLRILLRIIRYVHLSSFASADIGLGTSFIVPTRRSPGLHWRGRLLRRPAPISYSCHLAVPLPDCDGIHRGSRTTL